jgi:hypothetical protein
MGYIGYVLAMIGRTQGIPMTVVAEYPASHWSPLIDRAHLLTLAQLAKKYGAITTVPNMAKFVPSFVEGGKTLQRPTVRVRSSRSGSTARS